MGSSEGDITVGGLEGNCAMSTRTLLVCSGTSTAGRFWGGRCCPVWLLVVAAGPGLGAFGDCINAKSSRSMLTDCPVPSPWICRPLGCVSSSLGVGEGNTLTSGLPWLRVRE